MLAVVAEALVSQAAAPAAARVVLAVHQLVEEEEVFHKVSLELREAQIQEVLVEVHAEEKHNLAHTQTALVDQELLFFDTYIHKKGVLYHADV
jgi:hypothetical protein